MLKAGWIILAISFVTLEIRVIFSERGNLTSAPTELEAALQTVTWSIATVVLMWREIKNNGLSIALNELDDRSQDILKSRWLSDDKATLHDLADKYSISAERIRQLEKAAMNKIKAKMEA